MTFLLIGAWLVWSILGARSARFLLTWRSRRWLPELARRLAAGRSGRFFEWICRLALQLWAWAVPVRWGVIGLTLGLFGFTLFGWVQSGAWRVGLLLLGLPAAMLLHETGHAIQYARQGFFVLHIDIGLPLGGRTVSIQQEGSEGEKATRGIAGSAANLLAASAALLVAVLFQSQALCLFGLLNLLVSFSSLLPVAQDYVDITRSSLWLAKAGSQSCPISQSERRDIS